MQYRQVRVIFVQIQPSDKPHPASRTIPVFGFYLKHMRGTITGIGNILKIDLNFVFPKASAKLHF